jgi:hypothetical protein
MLLNIFPNIFLVQSHDFLVYPVGVWEPAERLSPVFPALPDRSPGGRGQPCCARPVTTVQHLPALLHTHTETSAAAAGAAAAAATASAAAAATTALSGMEKFCK